MLQCPCGFFSAHILEAAISQRSPWFLLLENGIWKQIWMLSVLIASRASLLLDTRQTELGNLYTLKPIFILKNFIGYKLHYNIVFISAVQQVSQLYVYIYSFWISFPIEVTTEHQASSLCYIQ